MNIYHATKADKSAVLELYRSFLHGAALWDENYPSEATIDFDLSRDALFVMKNDLGEIIATISIDLDDQVETLPCWTPTLQPSAELARLAVRSDMHNQGIAKQMMKYAFAELKTTQKKSAHILVIKTHAAALNSYQKLGFKTVGDCKLYNHDYFCMEVAL